MENRIMNLYFYKLRNEKNLVVKANQKDRHVKYEHDINEKISKLLILDEILVNDFSDLGLCLDSAEKIDVLIHEYREKLGEYNTARTDRIVFSLFSFLSGAVSILFTNFNGFGYFFAFWLGIVVFFFFAVSIVSIALYCFTYFDPQRRNYKRMIHDLDNLKMLKYLGDVANK